MNPERIKQLEIQREEKEGTRRSAWLILLGVLVLSGAALYFAWPREKDNQRIFVGSAAQAKSTNAVAASAVGEKLSRDAVLTTTGYIINRERIELSPRFMGVVKWIGVNKGDAVTNGQIVALLDDAEYKARLKESEGRLANAQVAVSKAELDHERIMKLAADSIASKEAQDDARLRLEGARASLKETQGQYDLAKTYVDWTVIHSTMNGVVLEKLVHPNELVMPQSFGGAHGPATAVVVVADPKDLQVEIDLNESDLAKIFLNQPCRVRPEAFPDKVYHGYIAEIAPEANRQKGTLQIKVQIREPDRFLTPELSARVDFLSETAKAPPKP